MKLLELIQFYITQMANNYLINRVVVYTLIFCAPFFIYKRLFKW